MERFGSILCGIGIEMGLHSDGVPESSSNTADLVLCVFRRSLHRGGSLLWSLSLAYSLSHRVDTIEDQESYSCITFVGERSVLG
jgi:hypothetical protein